ncbi:MAG: MBL fold metallo-hydrolase [Chloroflexi bacterium]|nr:MBL fold metallo-hydrolase [Chloroflexota bacterium]
MEITWLGHACFLLRGSSATVLTDPFPDSLGLSMGATTAAVVTVSNSHPNHSAVQGVQGRPLVLNGPGEYEVSGVYVRGVGTPLMPDADGTHRNTMFIIEVDDVVLCHVGDLSVPLVSRQLEKLTTCDVLFLPVGGRCTLPMDRVGEMVNTIEPRLVVPMHYAIPGLTVELDPVEKFLQEMGHKEAEPLPRLTVTRSSLPAERRVALLTPRRS